MSTGKSRCGLICCSVVLLSAFAAIAGADYFAFPFIGRWQPSEDVLLLDDYGLSDIQNMRRDGKALVPIKGHYVVQTLTGYPSSMFFYSKENPSESYMLYRRSANAGGGAGTLNVYSASLPSTFTDLGSPYTTTDGSTTSAYGLFSNGPQGTVIYCNGYSTKVWPGYESPIISAVTSSTDVSSGITSPREWINQVRDSATDSTSRFTYSVTSGRYLLIGSPYRLRGVKMYLYTNNATASTTTVKYWTGSAWAAPTAVSDYTSSGGVSLEHTDIITWTSADTIDKPTKYLNGKDLYWYQLYLNAGSATIYYITALAIPQQITNIWDGQEIPVVYAAYSNTSGSLMSYDYSTLLQTAEAPTEWTAGSHIGMPLGGFGSTSSQFIYFAFTQPVQALRTSLYTSNANAVTADLYYWNGSSFVDTGAVGNWVDSPVLGAGETPITSWVPVAKGTELPRSLQTDGADSLFDSLYYYKIGNFSGAMDSVTEPYHLTAVPSIYATASYRVPALFRNRVFLFNEIGGNSSKCIYSSYNTAYIFNGEDSGELHIGTGNAIIAAGTIYNMVSGISYEQMLVMTNRETYRVTGSGPTDWTVEKLSDVVGCTAANSLAVVTLPNTDKEGNSRQALIWQSDSGVVISDGSKIQSISEDIRCYWNPNDSRYIDPDDQATSWGWYDPTLQVYKLLVNSGGGSTGKNTELEYSLKYNEWTKIYREKTVAEVLQAAPIQIGGAMRDVYGHPYNYGVIGYSSGDVYLARVEYGDVWHNGADDTDIAKYIETGDLLIDNGQGAHPFFNNTLVNWVRVMFEDQASGAASITHWLDGVYTVNDTNEQQLPEDIDLSEGPVYTEDCTLGPGLRHRFRISSDDYMKLTGLGLVYEPFDVLSQ